MFSDVDKRKTGQKAEIVRRGGCSLYVWSLFQVCGNPLDGEPSSDIDQI